MCPDRGSRHQGLTKVAFVGDEPVEHLRDVPWNVWTGGAGVLAGVILGAVTRNVALGFFSAVVLGVGGFVCARFKSGAVVAFFGCLVLVS